MIPGIGLGSREIPTIHAGIPTPHTCTVQYVMSETMNLISARTGFAMLFAMCCVAHNPFTDSVLTFPYIGHHSSNQAHLVEVSRCFILKCAQFNILFYTVKIDILSLNEIELILHRC